MYYTLVSSPTLLNAAKSIKDKHLFKTVTIVEIERSRDNGNNLNMLYKRVEELGANLFENVPFSNGMSAPVFNISDSGEVPLVNGIKPGFYCELLGNGSSHVIVHYLNGDVLVTGGIKRRHN